MKEKALKYLRTALNNPSADFRDGQYESIELALQKKRTLIVQRTGWGKSMVYFIATKLFRDQGSGVTLLISPLLSLMRNQIEAAERIGIRARTINSTNKDDWESTKAEILANKIDLLLVSPERLANEEFQQDVLANVSSRTGLFVVDEAHCISDWGHDFRPDYRRIVRILQAFPSNVPVLATTATANERVVHDVMEQIGEGVQLMRGPLVRKSLRLQNITMHSQTARMAWLAKKIPQLPGSGIVYTLTTRDADILAEWLRENGINAKAYHSQLKSDDGSTIKEDLEQELLDNKIKVLVATVALGMGFDKPDLGFVIHYQRPGSVVHYYQQVGRAGRAVDEAYGILLYGSEDDDIINFFINQAFPAPQQIELLLKTLDEAPFGLSVPELEARVNLKKSQIEKVVKYLAVESPAPIIKEKSKWMLTANAKNYALDKERIEAITAIRRNEQQQMQQYMEHSGCLMRFLQDALSDQTGDNCGMCANCTPDRSVDTSFSSENAKQAAEYLKRVAHPIKPRKRWPVADTFSIYPFTKTVIPKHLLAEEGKALCMWRDAGWGELVRNGKYQTHHFPDELVDAAKKMIATWGPSPRPTWVACIPSLKRPELVTDFAKRLSASLELPFHPGLMKIKENEEQKSMVNGYQQAKNLDGVFQVMNNPYLSQPCFLVDDMCDSGWTFTVAAALLRQAGCPAVIPIALAKL